MNELLDAPAEFKKAVQEHHLVSVVFPEIAQQKAQKFNQVFADFGLNGKVFAAIKSINSQALIEAVNDQTGCDVASVYELEKVKRIGVDSQKIVATGPKNQDFLKALVADTKITISIDSLSELEKLIQLGAKNPLLFRLSRSFVNLPTVTKKSRFGLDRPAFEKAVGLAKEHQMNLIGVSFHIDSQQSTERVYAINKGLDLLFELQNQGFKAFVLDIGGSFGASYGMTKAEAEQKIIDIRQQILAGQTLFGYRYGLSIDGKGLLKGFDYPTTDVEENRLRAVLQTEVENSLVAEILRDNLVEVWIEPGAALFNQAGLTAAEIIDVSQRDGLWQIVVDAHRNQICFDNNEVILDPILISDSTETTNQKYAILGNLCTESDVMTYRLISLPVRPRPGDILVWTHTAAYRSHFSASIAISHPLAEKFYYKNKELLHDL